MKKVVRSEETNKRKIRMVECNTVSKFYSIFDNVIMNAQRVVIPASLQGQMLKEFHSGQQRISWRKSLMAKIRSRYREAGKILHRLCSGSKHTT